MVIDGNESIDIIRQASGGAVNGYGNPVFGTETITVPNVLVANGSTGEPVELARTPIDASLTIYLPAGTVIEDTDIFVVRGGEWVKDGDAQVWPQLWAGFVPGVVVSVRRRRG